MKPLLLLVTLLATDARNRVWIVHRLDRDTSGLIVFAKTEPYKRVLQQNWHRFDKLTSPPSKAS